MTVLTPPPTSLPAPSRLAPTVDELLARRALRAQIARLERKLTPLLAELRELRDPAAGRRRPVARVLDLGELECERDRLSRELTRVSGALAERAHAQAQARLQLEAMLANPARYRLARISCAALGESGCGEYAVRPRLGLLGMLAGWWEVKLSSGCP